MRETVTTQGAEGVLEVYHETVGAEKFNGMVFVKISSMEKREHALNIFNVATAGMFDRVVYTNPNLPLRQRISKSFLTGLKRLFVSERWGYQKSCIQFDEETGAFSVGGTPILKATACEFRLKLQWFDPFWASERSWVVTQSI